MPSGPPASTAGCLSEPRRPLSCLTAADCPVTRTGSVVQAWAGCPPSSGACLQSEAGIQLLLEACKHAQAAAEAIDVIPEHAQQCRQTARLGSCQSNKACPGCSPALLHFQADVCAQAAQVEGAMPTDRGPNISSSLTHIRPFFKQAPRRSMQGRCEPAFLSLLWATKSWSCSQPHRLKVLLDP